MGRVIRVRCNGPNRHVNEVDVDAALREDTITRGAEVTSGSAPERVVLRCRECSDGSVILTRAMIEDARQQHRSM